MLKFLLGQVFLHMTNVRSREQINQNYITHTDLLNMQGEEGVSTFMFWLIFTMNLNALRSSKFRVQSNKGTWKQKNQRNKNIAIVSAQTMLSFLSLRFAQWLLNS